MLVDILIFFRDFIFQKTQYEKLKNKTRIIQSLMEEEIPQEQSEGLGRKIIFREGNG